MDSVVLGGTGQPERSTMLHDLWVVATQDCDLDQRDLSIWATVRPG